MAPITATSLGLPRQRIDDDQLVQLIQTSSSFNRAATAPRSGQDDEIQPILSKLDASKLVIDDIDGLVNVLSKHQTWRFQEKVGSEVNLVVHRHCHESYQPLTYLHSIRCTSFNLFKTG